LTNRAASNDILKQNSVAVFFANSVTVSIKRSMLVSAKIPRKSVVNLKGLSLTLFHKASSIITIILVELKLEIEKV